MKVKVGGICLWLMSVASVVGAAEGAGADSLQLIRLENANVVVEVAPRLGGRIAVIRRPDGENALGFAPAQLAMSERTIPVAEAAGGFFPCQGHVVWLGPQQDWWTQQEANPVRRAEQATWPPDPWREYGRMEIAEQTASTLSLIGAVSPVSGLRLALRIRITAEGLVIQEIEAMNHSQRTVAWDIWPNTRARPDAQVFAPYDAGTRLRVEHTTSDPLAERPLPWLVRDGFLTFDTQLAAGAPDTLRTGKAFLRPTEPVLYAVAPHDLLIAAARAVAPADVHPAHAPVEVFQCTGGDPVRAVLELEFHSAWKTILPGASLRFAVGWRVLPRPLSIAETGAKTDVTPLTLIRSASEAAHQLRTALEASN